MDLHEDFHTVYLFLSIKEERLCCHRLGFNT